MQASDACSWLAVPASKLEDQFKESYGEISMLHWPTLSDSQSNRR